jgi:NAD(P)-dependent dehydrogenase (short-subunit alcohol dehydrogenase family)
MASALTDRGFGAWLQRMSFPNPLRAVITGAGGGLGRAIALELANHGASVVVSDIQAERAEETAELLRARGAKAEVVPCDVTDRDAVFGLVDETVGRLGGIDLIVNNAGVAVGGPFDETSMEDWNWIVDINLWGVIYGCQAAIPKMKEQGHGYVLNVASAAGLLCPPAMSAYNVTKAGVVALSETLFAEYKSQGIRVSVLCPTFFKTNIADSGRGSTTEKEQQRLRTWMERSKVQAPDVAKAAIEAVRDGNLYVQPMRDGRMGWRMKRAHPQRFYETLARQHVKYLRSRGNS